MKEASRLLLVVAPTLHECSRTVSAYGLSLDHLAAMRFVTRADGLRGWSNGTPFIAINRRAWSCDSFAMQLDAVLSSMVLTHRLRPASADELMALRKEVV